MGENRRRIDSVTYWRCYYHIIWATKHRAPLITADHETFLFDYIPQVAQELGSQIFAINGTQDHIHIAATIPPKMSISQWVKRIKGASSSQCNRIITNEERFHWQRGFGVLTYGKKRLDYVIQYIHNQKQHYTDNTIQPYLEHIDD